MYTFTNDIILDPFMGSGQTAIAAIKCGRNFVGYEISREYCTIAEKRIKDITSQKKITDMTVTA